MYVLDSGVHLLIKYRLANQHLSVGNHNTAVPFHLWIKAAVHICGHQMSPKKHVLKSFSSEPFFNT